MTETTIARLLRLDAAGNTMGIRLRDRGETSISLEQDVLPQLADHHGRSGLPMMSVLLDSALGSGAYLGTSSDPLAVVANMSVSMAHPIPNSGTVVATGSPIHHDTASGTALSRAELHDPDGNLLVTAIGRAAEVDRSLMDNPAKPYSTEFLNSQVSVDIPKDMDGLALLHKLTEESASIGSLTSAYGLDIIAVDHGHAQVTMGPQRWMLNGFGSIQGGVLVGTMALITELTGQTLTSVGQSYYLADIGVELLGSPRIADGPLELGSTIVRRGRRFCLIDATLKTQTGKIVARSTGTIITT